MAKELMKISRTLALLILLVMLPVSAASAREYSGPVNLEPQLSSDGKSMANAIPAVVYRVDPNPPSGKLRIPAPFDMATLPEMATSTFSITYAANGATDPWGKTCTTFPEEAKAAFNAAAAIWGNLLTSSVPITISACWSDLGSSSILGYSGGGYTYRDFTNAPQANTWYASSLANAIAGTDLGPSYFDMYITYNSGFVWYYGTDGSTPAGQYDLESVVLHEIAHGLNFSGSMSYSSGSGSWGSSGYPNIYDTFMRDGTANPGNLLIDTGVYPNPSIALGSALTSNNIWFHGTNAMAANGGQRVKMYAPSTWSQGSSYSHLDYDTFKGTENSLMVYAISSGVSTHDPGTVAMGIFYDLGWPISVVPTVTSTVPAADATGVAVTTTIRATFSKAMNESTITTSTFYLNNGVTGTVSYDDGTNTATFTPSANLALNTTYTATITTGVMDSGGHPMAANKTWSFTTTDGSTSILVNGDFESGADGWTQSNEYIIYSDGVYSHGGGGYAWLGGYEGANDILYQDISIPADATAAALRFWYAIATVDTGITANDILKLTINNPTTGAVLQTLVTLSNLNNTNDAWFQSSQFNLLAYKGQTIRLTFTGTTNSDGLNTNFFVDDVTGTVAISSTVVRIPLVGGYDSLQSAYNSAPSSCTIQAQAVELPALPFTLDLDKIIVLEGGYDSSYSSNSGGYTTMDGILTLGTGSLTVEKLIIK